MDQWLQCSVPGTLLMCHPADAAVADDAIGVARTQEYAHLRSEAFAQQLARHQVQLVRGAALYTGSQV
jgi:predicted glycoside hydrolase/deacetylase ChbG (UPF0249 family)